MIMDKKKPIREVGGEDMERGGGGITKVFNYMSTEKNMVKLLINQFLQ